MRPIIGITCKIEGEKDWLYLPQSYAKAIEAAGGMPLLLPYPEDADRISQLIQLVDGLLLSGGVDLDPSYFGEQPHPALGEISPQRDAVELALAREALQADLPVFAICRGVQLLNVAAGGTLVQDIPSQIAKAIKHSQKAPEWHPTHRVRLEKDSLLAKALGAEEVAVNSYHHQAVKSPAPGFRITAVAPDGVAEGLESGGHTFVLGVQWHPEGMWQKDSQSLKLFKSFVDACR